MSRTDDQTSAIDTILAANPRYAGADCGYEISEPTFYTDEGRRATVNLFADARLNAAKAIVAERLFGAIEGVMTLFVRPGEGSVDAYERMAEEFNRDAAMMAPGKSQSPHDNSHTQEERERGWQQWRDNKIASAFAACTAWRELSAS